MRLMNNNDDREIERLIRLMQSDTSYDAPQDAIQWSKNVFLSRAATKKSFVEKIFAVLQMDLSPNRAAFGERSASASQARQMLFQANEANVDLRVKSVDNKLQIQGQILGADFANGFIVIEGDGVRFETRANDLSEFDFAEIPTGIYDLILKNETREIVLANLDLS